MITSLKSKKKGIVFSYIAIAINSISSIVLIPFYLKYLGVDGYGFYQMIYSVASYILILDFGIGTTMIRFVSEYRTRGEKKKEKNFIAHCFIIILIINFAIVLIGLILSRYIDGIYPSLTTEKVILGQKMFYFMIGVLVMTVFERFFEGLVMAYEYFSIAKIVSIIKLVLKVLLVLCLLSFGSGVISLVVTDVVVEIVSLIIFAIFVFGILKIRFKLYYLDKKVLISMATFMFAIMLQSIVAYANNTIDKTILGNMLGETASGIYGLSMTFITLFNMIPTSILTIFLPVATKYVVEENSMEKHNKLAAVLGRYQLVICGGFISAFIIIGQDFIKLWAQSYEKEIWLTALIIIIPNAVPLIQNYCLNVLDAMNKRLFRSVVLLGLSAANIILTIIMIKWWGVLGAPIATAISYVIGHGIIINIYYKKKIRLDIVYIWKNICRRILLAIIVATAITVPLFFIECSSWLIFVIKALIWAIAYGAVVGKFGLNDNEKQYVKKTIKREKIK